MKITKEDSKRLAKALEETLKEEDREGARISIGYSPKLGTYLVAIEDIREEPTIVAYIDPLSLEILDPIKVGELGNSREQGQGLIEYAIILLLVGIVVAILVSVIGAAAGPLGNIIPNLLGL